ncbi:hypothetical protein VE03_05055 [Pseudogymnoascus sp. 23342-1-I1]|nr:hypothetical protein VE03_05055 [Pseudogymnoascus sp. 23342-1-I1]
MSLAKFRNVLGGYKKGKAEVASGTGNITDAAPLAQNPDLYSTEGSIGMKVVTEPRDAVLDIIFVHGLTGNRETTWTHKNGVFWPEQLAHDISTARIMTFGYDADVVKIWGMAGGNNLRNHGKSLAFAVSDRRRDCRERPVIFIAHSLGGLVCEQALLHCGEGDKTLEKVFRSTRGIIFMGTPHAGADLAKWGYILAKYSSTVRNTNSDILDPLRQKSDVLTAVQQQFQQLLRKPDVDIEIYCFFEEKPVFGVGMIVEEHSATLSQYPNQSIAANHMDMTKFTGVNDEGYQRVLSRVKDNIEVMESSNKSLKDPRKHPEYETRIRCHRFFRTSHYEGFKERNPDPVKGTCHWFLQHPNYTSWRNSHNSSILWVSADPGCGKSVLSKLLADEELKPTRSRTTCHFFFKDDNGEQKTATNALCALLHQVFTQKPELLGHAVEIFNQNGEKLKKNVDLLWQVLAAAAKDLQAGEIVCILDALDECKESELKPLLQKLCSFYDEQSLLSNKITLKFLVTSRPLQHIEDKLNDLSQKIPAIRLAGEEDTDQILHEINLVIDYEISKIQQKWGVDYNTVCALREEFSKVEHRTYLWVKLIFDLIHQDLQSITKKGREKLFRTIPKSLDATYTTILNKSTNKELAKKLLQIVCVATRPLSVKEISTALAIQEDDKTYKDLEILPEEFSKKYIRNICGLFIRIINGRVFLLHQTAKEFLIAQEDCNQSALSCDGGIWKNSLSIQDSSALLASICMSFLRLEELNSSSLEQDHIDLLVSRYEFFEYSAENWALHFRTSVLPDGHPLIYLGFELCDVQANRYMSWMLVFLRNSWYGVPAGTFNNLRLASFLGLGKVVSQLLAAPEIDVNAADNEGRTPLWWALDLQMEAVVRQLLAIPGIDVNTVDDKGGRTPLWLALDLQMEAVVRQLLAIPGINVNTVDDKGRTPLWLALDLQMEAVVIQLLTAPRSTSAIANNP